MISDILQNKILVSCVVAWFSAQLIKMLIEIFYIKKFNFSRLVGSGGMPSSHSATVCSALATSASLYGFNSFEFAICFLLSCIVLYDAVGVRRETGKQAKLLNMLLNDDFFTFKNGEEFNEKLKELVGHTPIQVFCGSVLGIIIGVLVSVF